MQLAHIRACMSKAAVRNLLKAIHKNVTSVAGNRQWRDYVVAQVRSSDTPQSTAERVQLAKDVTFLINNVATHKVCWPCAHMGVVQLE